MKGNILGGVRIDHCEKETSYKPASNSDWFTRWSYFIIIIIIINRKWEGVVRTGWSWLRIGKGGGRL